MSLIRSAVPGDAERLADLSAQLGYPISGQDLGGLFSILAQDPDHAVLVIEDQAGVVCGFVHILVARRLFLDCFAELGGFVIDQSCRGEGFGRQLLAGAESWAAERGIAEVRVRSNALRTDAHQFYLRRGFREIKKQSVFLKRLA